MIKPARIALCAVAFSALMGVCSLQRLRLGAWVCRADPAARSLGDHRLCARMAVEPQCQGFGVAGQLARAGDASAGRRAVDARRNEGMTAQDFKAPESVSRLQ